jgi:outer membrane lipoprotein-sorting protein
MTRFRRFARTNVVALSLALLGAGARQTSEVDALLDRWQKSVTGITSFTCRFKQEKKVSFLRRPLVSSGSLKYRDRKILWVTDSPSASFLSFDGKEARIYTPEFNTLEIYDLSGMGPGAGGAAPASGAGGDSSSSFMKGGMPGFTGDFAALRQQYDVAILPAPQGDKSHHLRFTPRDADLKKEVASIEFKLDEALMIQEWRLVRANGDELHLTISDFVPNAKVEEKELRFEVPAGVKVVRMGGEGKPAPPEGDAPAPKKKDGAR